LDQGGFLTLRTENLPDPAMKLRKPPIVGATRCITYHSLARLGVQLYGSLAGVDGETARFADNLKESEILAANTPLAAV